MTDTVAFIGLGAMGAEMAANLRSAGFALRVFNRTVSRAEAFAKQGGTACASIAEAVRGATFVVSIIADDTATREVMLGDKGVLASAAPGTVIIDSSTNTPAMAREVHAAAAAQGLSYVDAPVSGSIPQARGRELVFMVGGDTAAIKRAQPLFEAMGRMVKVMGGPGTGATIKLVNNMLSGVTSAAIAEAMMVAEAAGLDPAATRELLVEGAAGSRLMRTKIPKMQGRDFSPQFQLELMEKDLRYFLALAQDQDRPAPIASVVRSQYQAARRASLGKLDVAAVFLQVSGEKPPAA